MSHLNNAHRRQLIATARQMQKLAEPDATAARAPNFKRAKNIFIIRSGTPDLFKKCVRQVKALAPRATLHIVSHERDAALIQETCSPRFRFHAYTGGGSYSWENLSALHESLQKAKLDSFVMLTNSVYGYPHIADILYRLGAQKLHLFNVTESWFTTTREVLEFKTSCANVYQSICHLLYMEDAR